MDGKGQISLVRRNRAVKRRGRHLDRTVEKRGGQDIAVRRGRQLNSPQRLTIASPQASHSLKRRSQFKPAASQSGVVLGGRRVVGALRLNRVERWRRPSRVK